MKDSLVSIVIATYNRAKYIKKAVESVLSQTYQNIEIIIVDDGSTDKTPEIISEFSKKDPRIVILTNKTNLGFVRTLNKGIQRAQGKYIARLDDDDFWCDSKKLEKQVEFLEIHPDYALVGGGMIKIDEKNREIARYLFPEKDEDIRKSILVENLFVHSTVLFRKYIWEKIGGYDKEFDGLEDKDLWLKIGRLKKFYNFQEFFVCYLGHQYNNPGYAARNYGRKRQLKLNIRLRKKYRNDYSSYRKAILFCWASYFYSFLPFKQKLWPIVFKIRRLIFRFSPYKYFKPNQKMKIKMFNIRRKMPEPIKKPIRWIYHKWNIKIDQGIIRDLKEYYELEHKQVMRFLRLGGQLNADFWHCINPKTEQEVKKIYEDSPFYVFNLVFWHSSKYQRKLRLKFIELVEGRVLDYGAGIGDLCVKIAERGFDIDYADVQGKTFEFAKWLFFKNNYNIAMINLSKNKLSKKYNTILCIDVIEHVKDPKFLLKDFVGHLENNGRLIITALHPDISKKVPMHFEIKFDVEKYLNSLGMIKIEEPFLWIKK